MIPVEQTILAPPLGNCFPACIASIFEVSLDVVPHPTAEEGGSYDGWGLYMERFHKEFLYPRGLQALFLRVDAVGDWKPKGFALLGCLSPRGDWMHSVVCYDGEIVYDPHPNRANGVGAWQDWTVFYALNVAQLEVVK